MSRRAWQGAFAIALVYIGALAFTMAVRTDHRRPLYDGFVPPSSYRWVSPPAFFASGNVKPKPVSMTVALGPDGSQPAGLSTPDGQFAIDLGAGAIASKPGATSVVIRVTPVAPHTLGAVPDGQRGDGNAYRVEMQYQPGGARVDRLQHAGSLLIEIPELGTRLYWSGDGSAWTLIPTHTVGARQLTLAGEFPAPGDYLAATNIPELVTTATGHSTSRALIAGLATGAIAIAILVLAFFVARRRRARA
jgi:hypothetical protein